MDHTNESQGASEKSALDTEALTEKALIATCETEGELFCIS